MSTNKMLKKIIRNTVVLFIVVMMFVWIFEPVNTFAISASDGVTVQLTVDAGISISDGSNITMAPNLSVSANSSIGGSAWTVVTNNATGYTLGVKASASPALVSGGNSFADYSEGTPGTPDTWSVDSSTYEFGFSAYGTDVEAEHKGTGVSCGSGGTPDANLKYEGLTTSDEIISTRSTVTPVAGITSNLCVAAAQNGVFAPSGVYSATLTGTATTL